MTSMMYNSAEREAVINKTTFNSPKASTMTIAQRLPTTNDITP